MTARFATPAGTMEFARRHAAAEKNGFFRSAQGLAVSTLGLGSYLGSMEDSTDASYGESLREAVRRGVNFVDTSLNYRHQRSERALGAALDGMFAAGEVAREAVVVATKAGYLVPDAIPAGVLRAEEIAGQMHCLAPAFLRDQLERSRQNLRLETIDIFYLHNPETQLDFVAREEFERRMRAAFAACEEMAAEGKINYYGTATWTGYRVKPDSAKALILTRLVEIARQVAGEDHRFRWVQLPLNLAMPEAFTLRADTLNGEAVSVLEVAARRGLSVVGSASLLQSKLTRDLPEALPGAATDAQRALQFARSTPGVSVALAGMSNPEHVRENCGIAGFAPLGVEEYVALFQRP